MITASNADFSRRAQECSAHRMRQVAYEAKVVTEKLPNGFYKATEQDIYTYKCLGPCQQEQIFISIPKTK